MACYAMVHRESTLEGSEAETGGRLQRNVPVSWPTGLAISGSMMLPEDDECLQLHCVAPCCVVVAANRALESIQEHTCHSFVVPSARTLQSRLGVDIAQAAERWQRDEIDLLGGLRALRLQAFLLQIRLLHRDQWLICVRL